MPDDGAGADLGPTGEDALDCLLSNSGYRGLAWMHGAPEALRRKLARLGVALWKAKGLPGGLNGMVLALTGAEAVVWDWTFRRYSVAAPYALPQVAWPDVADGGDCRLLVTIPDPLGDTDRDLVREALRTVKPGTDTWTVTWALIADAFTDGLRRWAPVYAPGGPRLTAAAGLSGAISLTGGQGMDSTGDAGAWRTGRVLVEFMFDGSGYADLRLCQLDDANYYRIRVTASSIAAALVRDGVVSAVCSGSCSLVFGTTYLLDVRLHALGSLQAEVQVWLDGELLTSGTVS